MNKIIDSLAPDFRESIETLLRAAEIRTGYEWRPVSGRRTMAEQAELYAQGRTTPGKVVTNATPGSSAHNFGLACDCCPVKDGELWWEAPRTLWKSFADLVREQGLVSGFYFITIFDAPHVESINWRAVRAQWKAGKIEVA